MLKRYIYLLLHRLNCNFVFFTIVTFIFCNTIDFNLWHRGLDLTNSLAGVLTRFCKESVALISNIEAMFHQVCIKPYHSNALRFLWWPNGDLNSQPQEFMMTVHLFGGVSSPSCANFALRKMADDNQGLDPEIVNTVKRNFYEDDCLTSVNSEQDGISLTKNLTNLGFRLTKWLFNSREVIESIPESERARSVKDLDFDHALIKRALSVQWYLASDTFRFKITIKITHQKRKSYP